MMSESNYALRFPFKPLHWVTGLETEYEFVVEGLQCRLLADKPHLVMKVQPFATEQEALAYIPRLWGALAWTSVELRTGFIVEMQTDAVTYYKDPLEAARNFEKSFGLSNQEPVHGMISGDMPGVIPIGKNIRTLKGGDISGTVTYSMVKYAPALAKAMSQANIGTLYGDEKLRTAIELLSDAQRENSIRSKFLTCIIALEVLANPVMKHAVVQRLLNDLNAKIEEELPIYDAQSDEHHALKSLQRELVFRREASLRSSVRKLVLDGLKDLSENERITRSKDVVWAYNLRGRLVHDGKVPTDDLHRAHDIAYQILIDLLAREIGIVHT
jgi:hypothetical protein